MMQSAQVILASGSQFRRVMLENAGVAITLVPADVDEAAIRAALQDDNPDIEPQDVAEVLARAKAPTRYSLVGEKYLRSRRPWPTRKANYYGYEVLLIHYRPRLLSPSTVRPCGRISKSPF